MAANFVGPQGITTVTPPAVELLAKIGILEVADGSTGFAAFAIPKFAVPIGAYTIVAGANASQTISVGYTNGGTELINAFAPNSTGYAPSGAQTGTGMGVQVTGDKVVYLKASATLTTPVIVKLEYYIPQQGKTL
jgi:hypothetical protein